MMQGPVCAVSVYNVCLALSLESKLLFADEFESFLRLRFSQVCLNF